MPDAQLETKLHSYGFTDKDIATLRAVLEDPQRKDRSVHSLLVELKRRFYTACIFVFGVLLFVSYAISTNEYGHGLVYFVVVIFICLVAFVMIPLPLAWKAVKFLRKER